VTRLERVGGLALATALLTLAGCAGQKPVDSAPRAGTARQSGPAADPVPRPEPRSNYGNGPVYEVNGKLYNVLDTSYGYRERGVASWYGTKFHGRPTSSREPYDMHEMTAAHKTLPLPTYVRVRNLSNNRSIVVRVNDRGPFVDNRIIDLSYAAAVKLDMIRDGTSLVEVTAISFDNPPVENVRVASVTDDPEPAPGRGKATVYVQVGAFGDEGNARRRHDLLHEHGIREAFIHRDTAAAQPIYRVRIGPISGVDQYDGLVARLQRIGISETHLVTE